MLSFDFNTNPASVAF